VGEDEAGDWAVINKRLREAPRGTGGLGRNLTQIPVQVFRVAYRFLLVDICSFEEKITYGITANIV